MCEDLGDGSEGGDRDGCIDLKPVEHCHEVFIPMDGHAMVLGDGDDLSRDRTPAFGYDPRKVVAVSVIAQSNGDRGVFGHHPILSDIEAAHHASPFVDIVVTLIKR